MKITKYILAGLCSIDRPAKSVGPAHGKHITNSGYDHDGIVA